MYHINSKIDKPDIDFMFNRVRETMQEGIAVPDLNTEYKRLTAQQAQLASEIRRKYNIYNPNSAPQIASYLESLNDTLVTDICFVNDKWTTNKEALGDLELLGYEFATELQEYRTIKNHCETLKTLMDSQGRDGRIHPTVSLAKTNRITLVAPALMSIPKKLLWDLVVPRKKGNILISADIKNQEPGILINWMRIEQFKDALLAEEGLYETLFKKPFKAKCNVNILVTNDANTEGYREVPPSEMESNPCVPPIFYAPVRPPVEEMYHDGKKIEFIQTANVLVRQGYTDIKLPSIVAIEYDTGEVAGCKIKWGDFNKKLLNKVGTFQITGELEGTEIHCSPIGRKEFKTAWIAMNYGASLFGVRAICKYIDGDMLYNYFSSIKPFKDYRKLCKTNADAGNQLIKTYFGTVLNAREPNKNRLKRVLLDLPIQGTGADILALLLKHLDSEIERRGLAGKLSLYFTRHDEIILEADRDWVETVGYSRVLNITNDIISHQVDDWVPFRVETGIIGHGED